MTRSKLLTFMTLSFILVSIPAKAQVSTASISPNEKYDRRNLVYHHSGENGNILSMFEFVAGYVNKSWICTYDGIGIQREDFFGDSCDRFLHGGQLGIYFNPNFNSNFGLRTGLFFENYVSRSINIRDFCNHFSELDIYIPLQATYDIHIINDFYLKPYAGVGFQWATDGRYYKYSTSSAYIWRRPYRSDISRRQEYGNGWPKRVNFQAECGLGFHFREIGFCFNYSFGFVDQKIENTFDGGETYVTARKSRQDKMQASIVVPLW